MVLVEGLFLWCGFVVEYFFSGVVRYYECVVWILLNIVGVG